NVLPWRLRLPAVVTGHDLAVYAAPETFARAQRWHLRLLVPRAVAAAACVITPSEHARADVLGRFGTAPERVAAIPLGVEAAFRAPPPPGAVEQLRALHGLGPRLVACIGTVQPRKHVERVIEAFVRAGAAVATSAVPEVVGDAGVLVARSDPALLADALARLIAEPETRAALGAAARARAARFTWEETARQTRRVYEEVLGCV